MSRECRQPLSRPAKRPVKRGHTNGWRSNRQETAPPVALNLPPKPPAGGFHCDCLPQRGERHRLRPHSVCVLGGGALLGRVWCWGVFRNAERRGEVGMRLGVLSCGEPERLVSELLAAHGMRTARAAAATAHCPEALFEYHSGALKTRNTQPAPGHTENSTTELGKTQTLQGLTTQTTCQPRPKRKQPPFNVPPPNRHPTLPGRTPRRWPRCSAGGASGRPTTTPIWCGWGLGGWGVGVGVPTQ